MLSHRRLCSKEFDLSLISNGIKENMFSYFVTDQLPPSEPRTRVKNLKCEASRYVCLFYLISFQV